MGYDDAKKLAEAVKEAKAQREASKERNRQARLREGRKIMRKAIKALSSYHDKMTLTGRIKVKISGRRLLDKKLLCSIQSSSKHQRDLTLFNLQLVNDLVEHHDGDMGDISYRCWTFKNQYEAAKPVQHFSGRDFEENLDNFMAKYI